MSSTAPFSVGGTTFTWVGPDTPTRFGALLNASTTLANGKESFNAGDDDDSADAVVDGQPDARAARDVVATNHSSPDVEVDYSSEKSNIKVPVEVCYDVGACFASLFGFRLKDGALRLELRPELNLHSLVKDGIDDCASFASICSCCGVCSYFLWRGSFREMPHELRPWRHSLRHERYSTLSAPSLYPLLVLS